MLMGTFHGLAAHMDPLIFLFLLGLTGLFRLLANKGQKSSQSNQTDELPSPQTRPELPRREAPQDSDEERIRRFLEALGQPPNAEPPPPVRPRPVMTFQTPEREERARTVRPRRNLLSPLPPLTTAPPPLPKRVQQPRQITQPPSKEKTFVAPLPVTPTFEVHKGEGAPEAHEIGSNQNTRRCLCGRNRADGGRRQTFPPGDRTAHAGRLAEGHSPSRNPRSTAQPGSLGAIGGAQRISVAKVSILRLTPISALAV